ncbi:MAG: DUF523 and DUF1722 domain-containing protein [Acidobacteria bacterium]|nr:DUF523 and DUF1722 domain-containing protein [Acidobacteriota bacterium]
MTEPKPVWKRWHDEADPIRVGISSCLLGNQVRHDGGHKHDRYLTDVLGPWFEWVPVCPEVEIGLGTPRPTIRLETADPRPRLVMPSTGDDLTQRMEDWSAARLSELRRHELDGFVLKKGSPSCGMERVRAYSSGGQPARNGVGVFARSLMAQWPTLPVEEEGRLNDPALREGFIERVFCRHRWRGLLRRGGRRGELVAFHTAHKMIIRAHNEAGYRRLGRLVAAAGTMSDDRLLEAYERELFGSLSHRATPKRHANVLYHALGYLKREIDAVDKREAVEVIEDYRNGLVPLVVPVTLLRHHVRRHPVPYLAGQLYLEPHPKELMLRNRV